MLSRVLLVAVGASSLSSLRPPFRGLFRLKLYRGQQVVPDPDPPDPNVFGPSGSGSISQRYGSGSFYHQAKLVRKTLIPTVL